MLQRPPCFNSSSEDGVQWPNMQKVLLLSDDKLDFLGTVYSKETSHFLERRAGLMKVNVHSFTRFKTKNCHSITLAIKCSSPDATHPDNHTAVDVLLALWLLGVSEAEVLPLACSE